jgi:two-component system sensor histidine kinase YesM
MNMKDDIVPLSAEVNHVTSYLKLQKQRFDEQLNFEIEIEEKAEQILVPKMILQPIVENCFKHGFDQQIDHALIMIKARVEDVDYLTISVEDNGTGISEVELECLRRELFYDGSKDIEKRDAIGLKNIYDRLQIYYSNQVNMSVNSSKEAGFIVTITIPKVILNGVEHS